MYSRFAIQGKSSSIPVRFLKQLTFVKQASSSLFHYWQRHDNGPDVKPSGAAPMMRASDINSTRYAARHRIDSYHLEFVRAPSVAFCPHPSP
jgi:hypothetical protein